MLNYLWQLKKCTFNDPVFNRKLSDDVWPPNNCLNTCLGWGPTFPGCTRRGHQAAECGSFLIKPD